MEIPGGDIPHGRRQGDLQGCAAGGVCPVAELTAGAEKLAGRLVALTGQILVWEERQDDGTTTHLIIAVEDPAMTLQSGLLPVYIVYGGRIESFIYDTITVFGRIYGLDTYKSVAVQEKTLPRIDARHIDETDSTS